MSLMVGGACLLLGGVSTWAGCQQDQHAARGQHAPQGPSIDGSEIIHRLGMDRQLEAIAAVGEIWDDNLRRAIAMAHDDNKPPEAEVERALALSAAAAPAYASEGMLVRVDAALDKAPDDVKVAIARYLRSDEGEAVALVRASLGTGAGQQRLSRFLAELRGSELPGEFLAKLERWMAAERETPLLTLLTWDALERYGRQVTAAARAPTLSHLAQAQVRDAYKLSLNVRLRQQTAYMLQQVPPEAVDAHLAFWESDAGFWLAHARVNAVRLALDAAHHRAQGLLEEAAQQIAKQSEVDGGPPPDGADGGAPMPQVPSDESNGPADVEPR